MECIAFDAKTVDLILNEIQTWYPTKDCYEGRGSIEVIQRCSDLAMGTVKVVACIGPLTKEILEQNIEKFSLLPSEEENLLNEIESSSIYALILKDPRKYPEPVLSEDPISLSA
jgi:hypothetical protein